MYKIKTIILRRPNPKFPHHTSGKWSGTKRYVKESTMLPYLPVNRESNVAHIKPPMAEGEIITHVYKLDENEKWKEVTQNYFKEYILEF